jgi:hypothetical protein
VDGHFVYRVFTMNLFKQKDDLFVLFILYRKYTIKLFRFPNKKPEKFSGFDFRRIDDRRNLLGLSTIAQQIPPMSG